jgi:hypothetical protein
MRTALLFLALTVVTGFVTSPVHAEEKSVIEQILVLKQQLAKDKGADAASFAKSIEDLREKAAHTGPGAMSAVDSFANDVSYYLNMQELQDRERVAAIPSALGL